MSDSVRAVPLCPLFETCGGCQTQHVAYDAQLANKRERLARLLAKHFTGEIAVHAGAPYHYRNRMDFLVSAGTLVMRTLGGGTVAVNDCPIADERISVLAREVNAWLANSKTLEAFDTRKKSGVLKYCTIRVAREQTIVFMLNEESSSYAAHVDAVKTFAHACSAQNVLITTSAASVDESLSTECFVVKGSEYLVEDILGVPLAYHAAAFFQNNPRVAEAMVAWVRDALVANGIEGKTVVDAYGGVGTFAFALAPHCARVVSVESHPLAAPALARTKEGSAVTNIDAYTMDAGAMRKLKLPSDAVYLVDPPRSGMEQRAIKYLLEEKPSTIAYVSCNPSQLAKELVLFARYYDVTSAALFDLFPQTNHIECAVVLTRRA
jgi:23S rRNA (uracil1939-C5)-methyltransferase